MFIDLSNRKFGSLTALYRTDDHVSKSGRHYPQYVCKCDCGNTFVALGQSLSSGHTTNCGCLTKKLKSEATTARNMTHGDAHRLHGRNRLYCLWSSMKTRCYNQNDASYQRYGAVGIKICDEWLHNYPAFKEWALQNGYDINAKRGECTIDRIDPKGNYCPENCRFVSTEVQGDNRLCVIHVEYNGETHNLSQWAKITGINRTTLLTRYHKGFRGEKLFYKGNLNQAKF